MTNISFIGMLISVLIFTIALAYIAGKNDDDDLSFAMLLTVLGLLICISLGSCAINPHQSRQTFTITVAIISVAISLASALFALAEKIKHAGIKAEKARIKL